MVAYVLFFGYRRLAMHVELLSEAGFGETIKKWGLTGPKLWGDTLVEASSMMFNISMEYPHLPVLGISLTQ